MQEIKTIQIEATVSTDIVPKIHTFVDILNTINSSSSKADLRIKMAKFTANDYFDWGFGTNHMWVHEIINRRTSVTRLIFVEFAQ